MKFVFVVNIVQTGINICSNPRRISSSPGVRFESLLYKLAPESGSIPGRCLWVCSSTVEQSELALRSELGRVGGSNPSRPING